MKKKSEMLAIETQSPNRVKPGLINIFLGGSIEMGNATEWQKEVVDALSDLPVQLLNPRRDDWDSNWKQSIDNPEFKRQVEWELNSLELSDIIIFYIDPNTKSPVTMMELGIHSKNNKAIVFCADGFWRKGNIDVLCQFYDIKQVNSFEELIEEVRRRC